MGAYLAHPSIKAEAKARKQVNDSFSLKHVTLTRVAIFSFYLHRLVLRLDTTSFTSHPMANRAMKRPMEDSPEVVPAATRFHVMLRWDREGTSVAMPPES
jgi:hypothetical protein